MVNPKRIFIATIFGVVFGFVCWGLATSGGGPQMPWFIAVSIILSRTMMGFAIGISVLKMKWWLHGIILGAIFSIPMAFNTLFSPQNAIYIFLGTIFFGIIYGLLIELFTTIIFKQGVK
ncbi:MAG: hypothetical protein E3J23_02955 [Candidatus Stahlbacteria bacterium]|jgi:hypothetical protein|nr:MAG: hypothetical protein E3J23_02955 [Candidatus Stahlbacteria bacterium]